MQKALELMNLKIHTVISDLMGKTGKAILEAILQGERKAESFLPFVDSRIKASRSDIVRSLEGNWREEQLFLLSEHYARYKFLQEQLFKCDEQIERQLQQMHARSNDGIAEPEKQVKFTPKGKISRQKRNKGLPSFNTDDYLKGIHHIDVLAILGLNETSALEILSETGTDLSKWPTVGHFTSWLNLCPNNKVSGGKLLSSRIKKKKANAAAQAFRQAANGVQNSSSFLGHFFRRMKSKGGQKYAIVATGRKMATIYYKMITEKQPFNPLSNDGQQERQRKARIASLEKALSRLKEPA